MTEMYFNLRNIFALLIIYRCIHAKIGRIHFCGVHTVFAPAMNRLSVNENTAGEEVYEPAENLCGPLFTNKLIISPWTSRKFYVTVKKQRSCCNDRYTEPREQSALITPRTAHISHSHSSSCARSFSYSQRIISSTCLAKSIFFSMQMCDIRAMSIEMLLTTPRIAFSSKDVYAIKCIFVIAFLKDLPYGVDTRYAL